MNMPLLIVDHWMFLLLTVYSLFCVYVK